RSMRELEEVAAACGPDALAIGLDVSDEAACESAVARCQNELGGLDILVNNAGIATSRKFTDVDTELWRQTMAVDVEGPLWLTRAALPTMLAAGRGAVISIASTAGQVGYRYVAPYVAAKHALIGLTRALAVEYATSGVTFNCVCPYFVDTPMLAATIETIVEKTGVSADRARRQLLNPQGRLVQPEEVATVVTMLASARGRAISGQTINVDGGEVQS
ncbi:MAG TPA: SDR family oxidoreductase, partial [Solirubrobacterales bacterium]